MDIALKNSTPENTLLDVVNSWKNVVSNFKRRSDVASGSGLGWKGSKGFSVFEDTPKSIGDALSTTGWCVSASEALLNDNIFQLNLQHRNAKAKLISIDIKEQYWGQVYNGSQNKWHTAILVEDNNMNIVIDITCRQFGNDFIEKDIWDLASWQNKLRSAFCNHVITDFNENPIIINPIPNQFDFLSNVKFSIINNKLKDIISLDDAQRLFLTDYFVNKFYDINKKLLIKNISALDYQYIKDLTQILMAIPEEVIDSAYCIMSFETRDAAKKWLELFLTNDSKLPTYLLLSKSLEEACILNNIDSSELFVKNSVSVPKGKTYLVLNFKKIMGIESCYVKNSCMLLPYNMELIIKKENIYDSANRDNQNTTLISNTIMVDVENMI